MPAESVRVDIAGIVDVGDIDTGTFAAPVPGVAPGSFSRTLHNRQQSGLISVDRNTIHIKDVRALSTHNMQVRAPVSGVPERRTGETCSLACLTAYPTVFWAILALF